jgi:hypothetical protein
MICSIDEIRLRWGPAVGRVEGGGHERANSIRTTDLFDAISRLMISIFLF